MTSLGNPAIWWVAIPAMLCCLGWWLTRRDWRAGAALLCLAAGWLTWLPFTVRTKFDYYSLEFEPFLILCIVLCLGLIIGPATASLWRRALGASVVGAYVLAVVGPVLVLLSDPGVPGHHLRELAIPHVVPRLDLVAPRPASPSGPTATAGQASPG